MDQKNYDSLRETDNKKELYRERIVESDAIKNSFHPPKVLQHKMFSNSYTYTISILYFIIIVFPAFFVLRFRHNYR